MQACAATQCRLAVSAARQGGPSRPGARAAHALRPAGPQQQRGQRLAALGDKQGSEKKVLRREDEPDEYWTSKGEREGANPFSDPLAQIGILAILFPFLFLGVAIAVGWVDLSAGVYGK